MKNFFSNLFNRNKNPKSIVSFDIIDAIYTYLYHEQANLELKVKGIQDKVSVDLFYFPGSFDHEEGKAEIKKAGFENPYQVLNELYKKIDIGPLSQEIIEEGLEYDFMHIQFYSQPIPETKQHFKRVMNNFVILFCCVNNSSEINDFRILYSSSHFINYTKGLLDTQHLDFNNPKNGTQEIGIRDFKIVLQGICQYLNIEIPDSIELPSSENLIVTEEVTIAMFEEFIKLVSRGNADDKLLKKQAKKLFNNFKKDSNEYHVITEGYFDFFENVDVWNSDWKFDPEDAEYFISEIIGENLNFEYPEETYSHDLFPYIQSALERLNLELMSYDTYGDNYLFFVANKNDVERILELSDIIQIKVDKL
ncbi:MAG: hypothetical protein QG594_1269 [Bacteroidota bacterium]|nr:hypothetical protein [Bacteroidota bacterium]